MNSIKNKALGNLPLLSNQKRLWIMSQQDSLNPAYNLQLTYHFNGNINYDLFNRSVTILFDRHNTMFSVFKHIDGSPYIEIVPREVSVELVDFSNLPEKERLKKIFTFAIDDSQESFDIENGPLYRLYLLKESGESFYFHATIHHLIFDGWSRMIFVQDLSIIYRSLSNGTDSNLESINFHSYDFAALEETLLTADKEKELTDFWKDSLKDIIPELRLPTDYERGGKYSGLGRRESFEFSKECTSGLKYLSNLGETTLFNTVLSLLGILFQKYCSEDDICIGVPVSNRRLHPDLDKIFGLFINTVVVRLKNDTSNKFADSISYTKNVVKQALSNSSLPFEKVVEAVNPERISGVNPLFQVSLSWMTDLTIPIDFGAVKGVRVTLPEGTSPFDITFYMWEEGEKIKGDIEYNVDLFKRNTVLRLKDNLIYLADSVVCNPEKRISEISIISKVELNILEGFNKTDLVISDCLMQELFEAQALIHPSKTAVISGDSRLTYKELDNKSNQVARHLLSLGAKGGDVIGICLERSVEMVVSVLGVLKAGCGYLPLDPSFPGDRLIYMFEDSGAKIIISQSTLRDKFIHFKKTSLILIDTDKKELYNHRNDRPDPRISPQNLAYMIYTSGSTGRPKGVKVHHRAVVNLIESMSVTPGIKKDDIILAVVTLSFDMSVFELFMSLSNGATVVVAQSEETADGSVLINLIERYNITFIQATPSFWSILLSSGWKGNKNVKALCGGEALTKNMIRQILPKVNEFWNCYGPTETTVYSTFTQITSVDAPILIGKPINNTKIFIIDRNNSQSPIGAIGEVCIGGVGVTGGYYNRPELTSEKFIRFGAGGIVYRTGDLGRLLEDGNIELFGRSDNQIKLRGFRIEPGEIENLLSGFANVVEAVVKVQKFDDHDERLVAYLNVESGFDMSREEIKNILSGSLPPYMIPSYYQLSNGFPRLPNGKINKKALVFETKKVGKSQKKILSSLTSTQKRLMILWSQILKIQNINLSDNFFEIGGNSLLSIRLINRIREEFGVPVTFGDFLSNSTIGDFGVFIDNKIGGKKENIILEHETDIHRLPLTSNQERLWLISLAQPEVPSYIIRMTYRFHGPLNQEVFEKSLGILFERHHIVFSVFRENGGVPYCEIIRRKLNISHEDYTKFSEEERLVKFKELINTDSRKVFNLESGPLYRLYLIRANKDEYFFHMSIHHIIFDGWSQSVFVNDLNRIYNNLIKGEKVELEDLKYQQYDFAKWEANNIVNEESVIFWRNNLKDCSSVLKFPYDFKRSEKPTGRGGVEDILLPKTLSDNLRKISKKEGTSLFSTLLCAFGVQMHKYSGEDDINIGLPVTYRPHSDLEKVFGMFVNTVVVRLSYDSKDTFRDLIQRTNEVSLNAISHQDVSFETVVESVKPERILNTNPLFQVAFVWQNNINVPPNLEAVKSEIIKVTERASIFDITLYLWGNGDTIEGEIEYNKDILKPETIKRLKTHYISLLNLMSLEIDKPVSLTPLISDEELKMIESVTSTNKKFTDDKTIIELFERQVLLNPDGLAIEFDGISLKYKELNDKANKLAGVLQTYNIGSGDFVGILLKRSPELIILLLALFKIRAAYVPLNQNDPENRIISILETVKIKYVITNTEKEFVLPEYYKRLNIEQLMALSERIRFKCENMGYNSADSAYIIFTSGTTGTPKGVWVNHRSVVNLVEWVNETFKVSKNDKLLWVTNLSFDLSVYDIFGILIAGGIVRILSDEDRLDPLRQYHIILNEGITFWDSAPQTLSQITQYFNHSDSNPLLNTLRLVFLSGDWIPLSLPQEITSHFPSAVVIGLGGATEATVWSNFFIINYLDPEWTSVPYGKPIQNARYYILDDTLNHCRIKQPGSLYIGGECLALGYFNDPELTSSKFINDPFNPGSKLYLTGDKAQWMNDGNIEFLGRDDEQVKIRGYRVEMGEIKNVVLQNKEIKDAVVIPDKSDRHNIKVILFISTHNDINLEIKDLRKELRMNLPEFMIPSDIIQCKKFPVTSNGKTDTKALLSDYLKLQSENKLGNINICDTSEEISKTFTKTQKSIYNIWHDILKTEDISLDDDFFDLGGYSLLVLRLINQIKEVLKVTLTFRDFIMNPTINKLSHFIDGKTDAKENAIALVHIEDITNLPLTKNQKRLWIISKLQPGFPLYIIPSTYKFKGSLNHEIFRNSLNILFQRHHIVFSVVKEVKGEPRLEISVTKPAISYTDYSDLTGEEKSRKIRDVLQEDSRKAFDLEKGPLYRLYLIKAGVDEYYFHMSIHHIIFDGWSFGIMFNDLSNIYNSLLKGKDIDLEPLEFQQYDYAQLESNIEENSESLVFWDEYLKGCSPVLNFPYDFIRGEQTTGRCHYEEIRLSKSMSADLRRISKELGTSLFTTLMSAYGIQLHKYSGDNDLNIGLPVAHRPHTKLEKIFGMFVNTVVVRLDYKKGMTFRDMISRTDNVTMKAISHQDVSFDRVVDMVNPERFSNTNPLFQAAFEWQNNLAAPLNLEGIRSELLRAEEGSAIFDIALALWEYGDIIKGELAYNVDIIKPDSIIRFKENYIQLLQSLIDRPDQIISDYSLVSENDKKELLEFNRTDSQVTDCLVHNFFEARSIIQPGKTAIISGDFSMTYKELDEKSNQIAWHLISLGVRGGDVVGICLERSAEMIVSVLGVMKTGCCYLPMDPSVPDDRIKYMFDDSEAKVLISQSSLKEKFIHFTRTPVVLIDNDRKKIGSQSTKKPELKIDNESLAYVIYTSGSTGKPKGVLVHHKAVVNLIESMSIKPGIKETDILLAVVTLSFDMSVYELFLPLSNGATIVIADSKDTTDGQALTNLIEKHNITILQATPSLWNILLANGWKGKKDMIALCGGEALTKNMVRQIIPKVAEFWNCYGPTETTVYATCTRITDPDVPILIGKPINNTRIYILDKGGHPVPVGVIGEVGIGGICVTKGYKNLSELTVEKFISFENGEIIYKAGDMGRFLKDGNVELFGRIDNQIKIRGFRIEPGEIEIILSNLKGIKEAVVKLQNFAENDARLVAFLNVESNFAISKEEIANVIALKLPAYMVPSFFQIMDIFPRMPNGKINKNALIYKVSDLNLEIREDVNLLTELQRKVFHIWMKVLHRNDFKITDNFFNLGGNSLLAITVMSMIESEFSIRLGLKVFFDSPKIEHLAEVIEFAVKKTALDESVDDSKKSQSKIIKGEI